MGDFIQDPSAQDGLVERMEPASAVPGIDWAGPTREEVAALRRHPRFGEAMTASMRVPLDLYHGNRILNLITNDRGRYILAIFALHLHYSRRPQDPGSGLTATRLQTMCAEQGVCSFGRAGALIRLLRWTGYLTDAPATQDRRVRLLMPTERLFEIHRERWRRQLRAVIEPGQHQAGRERRGAHRGRHDRRQAGREHGRKDEQRRAAGDRRDDAAEDAGTDEQEDVEGVQGVISPRHARA